MSVFSMEPWKWSGTHVRLARSKQESHYVAYMWNFLLDLVWDLETFSQHWLEFLWMTAEPSCWISISLLTCLSWHKSKRNNLWSGQMFSDKSQHSTVKSTWDDTARWLLKVIDALCHELWGEASGIISGHVSTRIIAGLVAHHRASFSPHAFAFVLCKKSKFSNSCCNHCHLRFCSALSACDHIFLATQCDKRQETDHMWTFETHTGWRGEEA